VANESPELIEVQMAQTREALSNKVATLEQQVIGTLQSANDAVHETVESVKSAVQETVSSVKETVHGVKDTVAESVTSVSEGVMHTLDVRAQVSANPWLMVGGAAAAGFLSGMFLFRRRGGAGHFTASMFERATHTPAVEPAAGPGRSTAPEREELRKPSWTDELMERAGQEAKKLGEQALMAVVASAQKNINDGLPKLIDRFLKVPDRDPAEQRPRRSQFAS
jgi:ElaB/YqjD/DUF883 family membrane-anchored ribosome-binding protein